MKQLLIMMFLIQYAVLDVPTASAHPGRHGSQGACIESFCAPLGAVTDTGPSRRAPSPVGSPRHTLLTLLGIGLFCFVIHQCRQQLPATGTKW